MVKSNAAAQRRYRQRCKEHEARLVVKAALSQGIPAAIRYAADAGVPEAKELLGATDAETLKNVEAKWYRAARAARPTRGTYIS